MEQVYLKHVVDTNPKDANADINSPYSFLEWRQVTPGIVTKDVQYHYNSYVTAWFSANKNKPVSQKFVLRQKYLYLLDQLQLFFSTDEKNTWYEKVNLADEKELLLAIPYFARKLKNIALYYLKLRKKLKNTKLKYNTVGTAFGIEQEIYSYLLETFSSGNDELSPDLQTLVPSFSGLQQTLVVNVQELYDDKQYFDMSPTVPLSGYFDLLHAATGNFLATKGIVLSSSEWLFESFYVPLTSNIDSVLNTLTGNVFELSDLTLYGNFVQKYIAESKYNTTFAYVSPTTTENYDVSLAQGNNYFYYPYGTTDKSLSIPTALKLVALSSINISGATAGKTIEEADTMFVKTGDQIKGAWLRYEDYTETNLNVNATIKKDSTTSFIFPYPGYGLLAKNTPWTGVSFNTEASYNFLTKSAKAAIDEAYWSNALPPDSCNSILLNNTTLVENGATSHIDPLQADQFFLRSERNESTTVPMGALSGAWLYKFTRTAIPITPTSDNVIIWPYSVISTEDTYPSHLENFSYKNNCNPVDIHDLEKSFFIAASSIELADKIYKLEKYSDTIDKAMECVWLSGATVKLGDYKYISQNGFSALFASGQTTRFVWTGPVTPLSAVFTSIQHKRDCPFGTKDPSVTPLEWRKCTCKQVYYSPFGHNNSTFDLLNGSADCVICDTENMLQPFDFSSWRDSSNRSTLSSNEFAWYQTIKDPCAAGTEYSEWGNGQWITSLNQSPPFNLEPGKAYFYRRATSKTQTENLPPYVVNYKFNTNNTTWIEAKLTDEGTWVSSNKKPNMVLYPGDLLKYERQPNTVSYLLSTIQLENTSSNGAGSAGTGGSGTGGSGTGGSGTGGSGTGGSGTGSIWSTQDSIALRCGEEVTTTITWPIKSKPFGSTDTQYPTTSFADLTAINAWQITRTDGTGALESQLLLNQFVATFVPPVTGTYTIAVTATKIGGEQIRIGGSDPTEPTTIPNVYAIPQYYDFDVDLELETPSSGFLIEHPLKGWNYIENKSDADYNGCKPYWATLGVEKDEVTHFKGTYAWGYPKDYIEGYLPNHLPKISPINIEYNKILEYFRKGYPIEWIQPITFKKFVNTSQWCELSSTTTEFSNLSAAFISKQAPELTVYVNTNPTDIKLSNLVNGYPTEVFYYALKSFVWTVTAEVVLEVPTPIPSLYLQTQTPWTNLTNRFYPSIANIPVLEETYALEDVGGYFLPNNLGASQYINKNFDVNFKTENLLGNFLIEDTNIHVGGRGRTKQDQNTLSEWTENNQWIKESVTSGHLAGAPKKSLTKTLQTFVPYHSNTDETTLGLVTPQSRVSPWGGLAADEWTDTKNNPQSFTGVKNVSAWVNSQTLKYFEKAIDCWTSDIYGNQYGLFKNLTNVPVSERNSTPGELWIRTNNQIVEPGYVSLSATFKPFESNDSLYKSLTGNGINYAECYFDTLFLQTSSAIIFTKINYDYKNSSFVSVFDDTKYKLLSSGSSSAFRYEANWFFPNTKTVITLFTEISGNNFTPVLYEMDLNTRNFKKTFPITTEDTLSLTANLSSLSAESVSNGTIYFNSSYQTFQIIYTGKNTNNKTFVAALDVKKQEQLSLKNINLYLDKYDTTAINEPPSVLSNYLSAINVVKDAPFSISVIATNAPTTFSLINYSSPQVSVNNTGTFTGTLTTNGLHHINYVVSNQIGNMVNCLTLSAL